MTHARRAAGALALAAILAGCAYAGEIAVSPHAARVGPPPADLQAESVEVPVPVGAPMAAWLLPAPEGAPAMVLLHGVTDDRRQLVSRARFLREAGYAVLLVDLPGHGESPADRIGYGWLERDAAAAAVHYLRWKERRARVGVLGISLGGAAAALAGPSLNADALVLESVYSTFEAAASSRLRRFTGPLAPALLAEALRQLPPRLGVPADSLRPIDAVRRTDTPTFVLAGTEDPFTPPAETRALYDAVAGEKALWLVEGAGHVNLYRVAPEAYRERVLAFLDLHLPVR